jgi:hypothetical protein
MKGDFSRSTFNPAKRYDSVRMQQGRVQVDADWNEQVDIATHQREQALADVIGSRCAPEGAAGFAVTPNGGDLDIGAGRMYVDGVLCEQLDPNLSYLSQPDYPGAALPPNPGTYLVFLDVWKWHVTALEDPEIRETALGGRDTATRLKTVCQVKLQSVPVGSECADVAVDVPALGGLAARTRPEDTRDNVCVVPATAGYTRLENYLYRIEVHEGGLLGVDSPTFKWSRNNGTIVTDWLSQQANPNRLVVRSTGGDRLLGFHDARWVELTDDDHELSGEPGLLVEVVAVDDDVIEIDPGAFTVDIANFGAHPKIRRWDMDTAGGAIPIEIAATNDGYIPIESGVQVLFGAGRYRTGDYWLIPARAFIGEFAGNIEWPVDSGGNPLVQQPHGIRHGTCNLALVSFDGTNFGSLPGGDCRHTFTSLCELEPGCCTVVVQPGEDIQAAIDSLPPEGGCVCLRSGVHEIDETVRVESSDVLIHGESPGTRVLGTTLPLLSVGVPLAPRVRRIQVRDLRFESSAESAAGAVPAVLTLLACEDVEIAGCGISGQADGITGITLSDTDRITIAECDLAVPFNGIWAIEDSRLLRVRDNRIAASGQRGTDSGAVGVFAEAQLAPCLVENNRIEGFRVGVALSPDPFGVPGAFGAIGSDVLANEVTRFASEAAEDDRRVFAIDVAGTDCRVSSNVLSHASSLYGGIRAIGSRFAIDNNRITSLARGPGVAQLPVGVQIGASIDEVLAVDMTVRENALSGAQDAIVAFGAERAVIADNRIEAPGSGLRLGILFEGVSDGTAERNHISDASTALQFGDGERNRAVGNHVERGGTGLLLEQDNSVELAHNRLRETGGAAIAISGWVGPARLHSNSCERCGHEGGNAAIVAAGGFGELQIESCEIRDTALSPATGTVAGAAFGVFGFLLLQASLQSNHVASALTGLDALTDPSSVPAQRAVFLLGFLDLQLTDNVSLGFPAQILGNRFSGVGQAPVVEVAAVSLGGRVNVRFNRVLYNDNFCWHVNLANEAGASVRIDTVKASAMGNHFKSLQRIAPIDFGSTRALYLGNATDSGTPALGSSILPTPQNAFNR